MTSTNKLLLIFNTSKCVSVFATRDGIEVRQLYDRSNIRKGDVCVFCDDDPKVDEEEPTAEPIPVVLENIFDGSDPRRL